MSERSREWAQTALEEFRRLDDAAQLFVMVVASLLAVFFLLLCIVNPGVPILAIFFAGMYATTKER